MTEKEHARFMHKEWSVRHKEKPPVAAWTPGVITLKEHQTRVEVLEKQMAAIGTVFTGEVVGKLKEKKKGKSKEEKEARKQELLKGSPYKKADIEAMGNVSLRILGAVLGVKTFGSKLPELIAEILKVQKKATDKGKNKK